MPIIPYKIYLRIKKPDSYSPVLANDFSSISYNKKIRTFNYRTAFLDFKHPSRCYKIKAFTRQHGCGYLVKYIQIMSHNLHIKPL